MQVTTGGAGHFGGVTTGHFTLGIGTDYTLDPTWAVALDCEVLLGEYRNLNFRASTTYRFTGLISGWSPFAIAGLATGGRFTDDSAAYLAAALGAGIEYYLHPKWLIGSTFVSQIGTTLSEDTSFISTIQGTLTMRYQFDLWTN